MKVLGIETATRVCGVAVVEENLLLAERSVSREHIHSERVVPFVEEVLKASRTTLQQIDGVAVSIGPGSFTGLRIGLSAAKGLCFASGKPLAAVPTLDALAHRLVGHLEDGEFVCAVLDAKQGQVYAASYEHRDAGVVRKGDMQVLLWNEFLEGIVAGPPLILTGEGAERAFDRLRERGPVKGVSARVKLAPAELREASPRAVAALGMEILKNGTASNVAEVEPLYLKKFLVRV